MQRDHLPFRERWERLAVAYFTIYDEKTRDARNRIPDVREEKAKREDIQRGGNSQGYKLKSVKTTSIR